MYEDYLIPNITNESAVDLIKEKVKSKTPFAFTRFGDGEIHIINKNGYPAFEEKICRQWGYKYPEQIQNVYDRAGSIIKEAFIKSDLIGLMDPKCKIINLNYNPTHWSLKKEFIKSWGVNIDSINICDHMLSRNKIFGSIESMKEIIQGQDIHIISPNVERLKQRKISEILNVNVSYTNHPESINFENRNELMDSFKDIDAQILLIGIGLQKDYGVHLRDKHNKIVFDMGATLDAWAGIISRIWFDKGNKQDYLTIN